MSALNRLLALTWILLLTSLFYLPSAQANSQQVAAMQIGHASDKVSIYVGLNKIGQYKVFSLSNPSRVVLDLTDGAVVMGLPTPNEIFQASHGLIKNVRNAQFNQQTHRLVFELTEDVRLSSEELLVSNDSALPRLKINMQWRNAPKVAKPFKPNSTPNVQSNSVNNPKTTAPKATPATITPLKKLVVAIDAGHGGKDPGAIGKNKTQEKKIVLSVSKKLANLINKDPRMEAVLTRTGDYYVGLGKRTQIARQAHADVFLSIHADAVVRRTAKGSSVYVLSNKRASSEFAKMLAKNENAAFADGVLNGKEEKLKHVLLDMSKDYVLHESTLMATDILSSLSKVGSVHSRKIGRASFAVLKSLDIPSVLIETAFISNPGEEKKLNSQAFQDTLALAIYNGLVNYAKRGVFGQLGLQQ